MDNTAPFVEFVRRHRPLFVLTGAGCSTASGIPDYRDPKGRWKRGQPVLYQDFVAKPSVRQHYWARSLVGWPIFTQATPNSVHRSLADFERIGLIHQLVTQNVDGLHQRAGSRRVIDLHGRLDAVECLNCRHRFERARFQTWLLERNPEFKTITGQSRPDGDAEIDAGMVRDFRVPGCEHCGGTLKPSVVFFGESIPRARVDLTLARLRESRGLLILGSSLMVFSGYRFCRTAVAAGMPIAAVNLGRTRADDMLSIKLDIDCGLALSDLAHKL